MFSLSAAFSLLIQTPDRCSEKEKKRFLLPKGKGGVQAVEFVPMIIFFCANHPPPAAALYIHESML